MSKYQYRLTPKAGGLGLTPTNNNITSSSSSSGITAKKGKSQDLQEARQRKPEPKRESEQPCPCIRDKQTVLCQSCGHYFQGRVKAVCALHPRAIFLLDVSSCPQCRAGVESLKEFPNIAQQQPQRPRQRLNSVKKRKCDTPESSEMEMGDTD